MDGKQLRRIDGKVKDVEQIALIEIGVDGTQRRETAVVPADESTTDACPGHTPNRRWTARAAVIREP